MSCWRIKNDLTIKNGSERLGVCGEKLSVFGTSMSGQMPSLTTQSVIGVCVLGGPAASPVRLARRNAHHHESLGSSLQSVLPSQKTGRWGLVTHVSVSSKSTKCCRRNHYEYSNANRRGTSRHARADRKLDTSANLDEHSANQTHQTAHPAIVMPATS